MTRTAHERDGESGATELIWDPLFPVALLKVAMELRKGKDRSVAQVVEGVVRGMELPPGKFTSFVAKHRASLEAYARRHRLMEVGEHGGRAETVVEVRRGLRR